MCAWVSKSCKTLPTKANPESHKITTGQTPFLEPQNSFRRGFGPTAREHGAPEQSGHGLLEAGTQGGACKPSQESWCRVFRTRNERRKPLMYTLTEILV